MCLIHLSRKDVCMLFKRDVCLDIYITNTQALFNNKSLLYIIMVVTKSCKCFFSSLYTTTLLLNKKQASYAFNKYSITNVIHNTQQHLESKSSSRVLCLSHTPVRESTGAQQSVRGGPQSLLDRDPRHGECVVSVCTGRVVLDLLLETGV